MNVDIGNEAAQFHFWEYLFRIFGTVKNIKPSPDFFTNFINMGIFLSNFRYSAFAVLSLSLSMINGHKLIEKLFIYICFTYSYKEESLGQCKVLRFRGIEGGRWYRKVQEEDD